MKSLPKPIKVSASDSYNCPLGALTRIWSVLTLLASCMFQSFTNVLFCCVLALVLRCCWSHLDLFMPPKVSRKIQNVIIYRHHLVKTS